MFNEKIKSFFGIYKALDDDFFDGLADLLVEGDFPAADAFKTVDTLRAICKKEKETDAERAKAALARLLLAELASVQTDEAPPNPKTGVLNVILLLGVNGAGKTTSAAKLASLFQKTGKPLLAAADTFRAAAVDQLKIHGERLGVRVVAGKQGGDSAACVYDALEAAYAGSYNPVIVDTAGRMHTKQSLVDELKKIDRIVLSKASGARYKKYLVLDSTTGYNAFVQAETFNQAVKVDGVILTKCDSSAKGGVVFPLASKLRIPVLYLCFGENYESIKLFNAENYVKKFLGEAHG
ncbi:MAG: signal recognition particle-docking protein FtsY [Spirochaetaceae bacterium]|jgi:fused signal recognition particle receptor|nr:signal recognition particle-docking protein FtsY [Spirochaetaceae bacterium]